MQNYDHSKYLTVKHCIEKLCQHTGMPVVHSFKNRKKCIIEIFSLNLEIFGCNHLASTTQARTQTYVTPNLLDATAVYQMASWILAEFIRIFHSVSTQEAQSIVDTLVERKIPLIWEIEGTKRILDPKMKAKGQVLLFLYQSLNWVSIDDLSRWTEYSHKTNLTNKVVKPLHISRLIEYQPKEMRAKLSPLGAKYVETKLLPI